jgi:hypothetical protein
MVTHRENKGHGCVNRQQALRTEIATHNTVQMFLFLSNEEIRIEGVEKRSDTRNKFA